MLSEINQIQKEKNIYIYGLGEPSKHKRNTILI